VLPAAPRLALDLVQSRRRDLLLHCIDDGKFACHMSDVSTILSYPAWGARRSVVAVAQLRPERRLSTFRQA